MGNLINKKTKIALEKMVIGSMIAAVGAGLTYLTEHLSGVSFGEWTPIVVAVLSVLTNGVRKLGPILIENITDTK